LNYETAVFELTPVEKKRLNRAARSTGHSSKKAWLLAQIVKTEKELNLPPITEESLEEGD
jgi:hypothetical protein